MGGLDGVEVLVLAGGLGTRIRSVLGATPKVLAPMAGRPYLDRLLEMLAAEGAAKAVLSLGHLADMVIAHLQANPPPLPVETVIETEPLGTAGAIRLARAHLRSDPALILNGDTWLVVDFGAFTADHRASGRPGTLLAVPVADAARYGTVEIEADGTLSRFVEKGRTGPGSVSAGALLASQALLDQLMASAGPSIEQDFLGKLPAGSLRIHRQETARFIDIGTPESLASVAEGIPGEG